MNIKYFGYNGFVVEEGDVKVAIDPGANLYVFDLGPVIPKSEWPGTTHVVVTHADPDHYFHADRVAGASGAPIICGSELVAVRDGKTYLAHPRTRLFKHTLPVDGVVPVDVGDKLDVGGVPFEAYPSVHGELKLSFLGGLVSKTITREPDSPFAKGETAFLFELGGLRIANLGDTLKLDSWSGMNPDILMLPIGGKNIHNTMDEYTAAEVVAELKPRWVIPAHYDCGVGFNPRVNTADVDLFASLVKKAGVDCVVMQPGHAWAPEAIHAGRVNQSE